MKPGQLVRLVDGRDHVNGQRYAWYKQFRDATQKERIRNISTCSLRVRAHMVGMFLEENEETPEAGKFLFEEQVVLFSYALLQEIS